MCSKCGVVKPLDDFHKKKDSKDGKNSRCKSCAKKVAKEWVENNPGRHKDNMRKWIKNNHEKRKEYEKKYRDNNPQKAKAAQERWIENNPGIAKERSKKWVEDNHEQHKDRCKKYYLKNTEIIKERVKNWSQTDSGKISMAKCQARRNRDLGYIPLNKRFEGCEGHHVTSLYVIYIPGEMHRSIRHRQGDVMSMHKINGLAIDYLNNIYTGASVHPPVMAGVT